MKTNLHILKVISAALVVGIILIMAPGRSWGQTSENFETGYTYNTIIGTPNYPTTYSQQVLTGTAKWIAVNTTNSYPARNSWSAYLYESGVATRCALFIPVTLTAGHTYSFSIWAYAQYANTYGKIEVKYGTTASDAGMTTSIIALSAPTASATFQQFTNASFTPASSASYIGIYGQGPNSYGQIYVDDISLTEVITTYYSKAGQTDPNNLSNWTSNNDGSGSNPVNFTTNGKTYIIQNGHTYTTSAAWGISGLSSKLQIANGGTLIATSAITIGSTATFQIDNGGIYKHQNTSSWASTIFAGAESFGNTSTIEINATNATLPTNSSYGNLKINLTADPGASINFSGNLTTINGDLTIQNTQSQDVRLTGNTSLTATIAGKLSISGTTSKFTLGSGSASPNVTVNGNFEMSDGTFSLSGSGSTGTLNCKGNFTHTGGTITETSSGSGTININGNTSQTIESTGLTNSVNFIVAPTGSGTVEIASGKTFTDGGSSVFTISNTSSATELTVNGTLSRTSSAGIVANGTMNVSSTGTYISNYSGASIPIATWGAASTLQIEQSVADGEFTESFGNVIINGSSAFTMHTSSSDFTQTIQGSLTMNTSGNVYVKNNSYPATLTINGNLSLSGSGSLIINGSNPTSSDTRTIIVNGNYNQTNGTMNLSNNSSSFITANSAKAILEVKGNFSQTGGVISETAADDDYITQLVLSGTASSAFTSTGQSGRVEIVANKTGTDPNNIVSLSAGSQINYNLTLTAGIISLSGYNLTLGATATLTGAPSATKYIKTGSTGQLIRTVGSSAVLFPVGNTAYNPFTITNSGTSDTYGVRVTDGTPPGTLINSSKVLNRIWIVTEGTAGGSNLAMLAQWNSTDSKGANFDAGTTPRFGIYDGSIWSQNAAVKAGSDPYTFTSSTNFTNIGTFALGKDDAFIGVANPLLSVGTITGFGNVCTSATAGPNTFTITGSDLSAANVTVAALTGYTYCTTSGGTYTSSLSLTQSGGSFSQDIYVKFTPTAVQSYIGDIVVGGGGASDVNRSVSGSGINTAPTVTAGSATAITINSATVPGSITSTGCSSISAYGIEYSTGNGFTDGTGILVAGSNLSGSDFSADLSGLAQSTPYYYHAVATNSGGTSYSAQGTFTTATPTLSAGTISSNFENTCINTTSSASTFTISGTALTGADVSISGPSAAYTFATSSGGTYTTTLTLTAYNGATPGTIYVKYSPTSTGTDNGNITISGGGASDVNCSVSGSGVNTAPTVATTSPATSITATTVTLSGNVTAEGCQSVTARGICYGTSLNPDINGTLTTETGTTGTFSSNISNLSANTPYHFRAYATSSAGTSYGTDVTFTTSDLDAPVAAPATDITSSGFTANWGAVTGAAGYRLDVSTSATFGTSGTGTLIEGFSGGATPPTDWTFTSIGGTYTTSGNYGASSPSLKMDATDDRILTPTLNGISTQLSFWIKGQGTDATSALLVEGYNGSSWSTIQNITNSLPTTGATITYNSGSTPALPANIVQFRFTYSKSVGNLSFDDVSINYNTSVPSFVTGYNNLTVNGTSQAVSGLASTTPYYYRVRAVGGNSTSANSNTKDVLTAPAAPTGPGTQAYCFAEGKLVSDLTATLTGTDIKWYDASTSGTQYTGTETLVNASYFASQTVGGLESTVRKEVAVTIHATPTLTITNPAALCSPATADLTAAAVTAGSTSGLTFTYWTDNPPTSQYMTPTAATAGTYYIKGTDANGCYDIKSVTVTVNTSPTVVITNPAAVCSPATVDLTASAVTSGSTSGLTYTYWTDNPPTIAYTTPTTATTGTYYIKGTDLSTGCYDIKPVTVTVNPLPTVTAGTYSAACSDGADVALAGNPAGGVWSGTGVSGSQIAGYVFDPSAGTQTLTYTYTDVNTCVNSAQTIIGVGGAGGPVTTAATVAICEGSTTVDIPIKVASFNNIGVISLRLNYNPAELGDVTLLSQDPNLNTWNFLVTTTAPGSIKIAGFGSGFSLANGAPLLTLHFSKGSAITAGSLTFVENAQGTYCEYAADIPPLFIPFCDKPTNNYYVGGGVTIDAAVSVSDQPNQTLCNTSTFTVTQTAPSIGTGIWTLQSGTADISTPAGPGTTVTGITAGNNATVRWTVTNGACVAFDDVVLTNNALQSISGSFIYNNTANTLLTSDVTVGLYQGSTLVTGIGTNPMDLSLAGTYSFTNVCPGNYEIRATSTHTAEGSVNGTDAAQVNYWPTSLYPIENGRFYAGDVKGNNNFLSALDAQLIQDHFVNETPFDRPGNWIFWKAGTSTINSNIAQSAQAFPGVTLAQSPAIANIYALCTGDFNRSFNPSQAKSASTTLHLINEGNIQAGPQQESELPLRMVNASAVGAVSLILNFPTDLVEVQNITMNTTEGNLDWAMHGNELRIGWNSMMPMNLSVNDVLLTLKLKTTAAFTSGAKIEFTLAPNPLNELADDEYNVIPDALLGVDVVEASTVGIQEQSATGDLSLSNRPNPFNGTTVINYTLPVEGNVVLEIRNLLGETVMVAINEIQPRGSHSLKLDGSSLPAGIYFARLSVKTDNNTFVRTIKMVNTK